METLTFSDMIGPFIVFVIGYYLGYRRGVFMGEVSLWKHLLKIGKVSLKKDIKKEN